MPIWKRHVCGQNPVEMFTRHEILFELEKTKTRRAIQSSCEFWGIIPRQCREQVRNLTSQRSEIEMVVYSERIQNGRKSVRYISKNKTYEIGKVKGAQFFELVQDCRNNSVWCVRLIVGMCLFHQIAGCQMEWSFAKDPQYQKLFTTTYDLRRLQSWQEWSGLEFQIRSHLTMMKLRR